MKAKAAEKSAKTKVRRDGVSPLQHASRRGRSAAMLGAFCVGEAGDHAASPA
jgi:hypothetical protein